MAKRDEFKLDLTANDQASKVVDALADKVEGLNTAATVEVTAEDAATEVIEAVGEEVETLDGEAAEVELAAEDEATEVVEELAEATEDLDGTAAEVALAAEDEATEVVEEVTEAVETLDGETATPTLDADDQASGDIEGVSGALSDLDGESAAPLVEIEDDATSDIEDVSEALSTLDGESATPSIGVEGAEEAETATGGISDDLHAIGMKGGLAALSATGLLAIGTAAQDSVQDVDGLSRAVGGTLEETSRLKEAWELAGGSIDTLERNIIRANDRLRESPEIAERLGIKIDDNTSPLDVFVDTVEALNSGQLTANERLDMAMDIFGSRGILMLNDLDARVGDLGDAMASVSDSEIITQADVDAANRLNQNWDTVSDTMDEIARQLLPGIASGVENVADILGSKLAQKLLEVSEKFGLLQSLVLGPIGMDEGSTGDLARRMIADRVAIELASGAYDDLGMNMADVEGAAGEVADATDDSAEAARNAAEAVEEHIEALQADADALRENIDALHEQADAISGSGDAYLDLREAEREALDSLDAYHEALKPVEDDTRSLAQIERDHAAALDTLVGSYDDAADAAVESARVSATASGASLSEAAAINVKNQSLLTHAATLEGPERTALLGHILRINGIPEERITTILTDADPNDLAQVELWLANASRSREAQIRAQADAQALMGAEAKLAYLARNRDSFVFVRPVGTTRNFGAATGDPFTNEGSLLVGEEGPEIVDLPAGSRVTNAGQSAERMRNGSGGGTVVTYVTQNFPAGVRARDTAKALRRYERLQAS